MGILPPSAKMWCSQEHLDLKPQLNTEFLAFAGKTQSIALVFIYLWVLKRINGNYIV